MSEFTASRQCSACKVTVKGVLHLHIGQNGARRYTWVCPRCNFRGCFPPLFIPNNKVESFLTQEQIDALPVIMPDASNRCVKCGDRKAELHHWAPKEIFGDVEAERWPKDYLCVPCHIAWHEKIKSA